MSVKLARLEQLPGELLIEVSELLDDVALCHLASSSHALHSTIASADTGLWKARFVRRQWRRSSAALPVLPSAGSWRESYARAAQGRVLLMLSLILPPGSNNNNNNNGGAIATAAMRARTRLELSRSTALFALKRAVRERQMETCGIYLEDFELKAAWEQEDGTRRFERLFVNGNDSFPPPDVLDPGSLRGLIEEASAVIGGMPALEQARRVGIMEQFNPNFVFAPTSRVNPWSINLWEIPDGTELVQVLVSKKTGDILPIMVDEEGRLPLTLNSGYFSNGGHLKALKTRQELDNLIKDLDLIEETIGCFGFKAFWSGKLHPLLHAAQTLTSRSDRLLALYHFFAQFYRYTCRSRFISNVIIKSLLAHGFFLSIFRIFMKLSPFLISEICTIFSEGFDIFPMMLARFIYNLVTAASAAFIPVISFAVRVELVTSFFSLALTTETRGHYLFLSGLLALLPKVNLLFQWGMKGIRPVLTEFHNSLKSDIPSAFFASALAWSVVEKYTDPGLYIRVPFYAHFVPIILTMLILRLRLSINQNELFSFIS